MKKLSERFFFRTYRKPTDVFGLKYRPSLVVGSDADEVLPAALPVESLGHQWSYDNRKVLRDMVQALPPNAKIVEIGVHDPSNGWNSSTLTILRAKAKGVTYVGFDIADRSGVAKPDPTVKLFRIDSNDRPSVLRALHASGVDEIDLLVIDGPSSVNQVVNDWQFAERVRRGGSILLHGTNYHPGPHAVFNAVSEKLFLKSKLFVGKPDHGVGVLTRL